MPSVNTVKPFDIDDPRLQAQLAVADNGSAANTARKAASDAATAAQIKRDADACLAKNNARRARDAQVANDIAMRSLYRTLNPGARGPRK